jgi:hypothetical protein
MRRESSRLALGSAIAAGLGALAAGIAIWNVAGNPTAPTTPAAVARKPATATPPRSLSAPETPTPEAVDEQPLAFDPLKPLEEGQAGWDIVNLEHVRAAMPDNIYWTMSSPTDDPAVLEARDEERERWNTEYGKVLSNTATKAEVDAYYAHRQRLSTDYIELGVHLLEHYGEDLPRQDVALLKVAIELHVARLEEIPRQIMEAHERREAHDAARRAWLEDQAAFEADLADSSATQ